MPRTVTLDLNDLSATHALAARLARLLRPGDAVLLEGPLGAGKSEFARAVLRAAAGDPTLEVPSPTFTLVQSYDLPAGAAHHFDLYRLDGPAGLDELGWDEALEGIVLVEWPDRLGRHRAGRARCASRWRPAPRRTRASPGCPAGTTGWRPLAA